MKTFFAFIKKELLEHIRSGKALYLSLLFIVLGIMNPAIAKMTPYLLEVMADSLAQSGMTVTALTVSAADSWVQFFKNAPMGLIVFMLAESSIFTKEYQSGTLIPALAGGFSRHKIVLGKSVVLIVFWSLLYWLSFAITCGYTAYFWDNSVMKNLFFTASAWWLFSLFCVTLIPLFSSFAKSGGTVLLGCGSIVLVSFLIGLFAKTQPYVPTYLMSTAALLSGSQSIRDTLPAFLITAALSLLAPLLALPLFRKRIL